LYALPGVGKKTASVV